MTKVIFELIPTSRWEKRLGQLKNSIKKHMYDKAQNATKGAIDLASQGAPVFNEAEYSNYWKWIFNNVPGYRPEPGALKGALVYDVVRDELADEDGYWIGYGNIQRLNDATDNHLPFVYIGGKNANQPEKKDRGSIHPSKDFGYILPIDKFTAFSLHDFGYWYAMEMGMSGDTHTIKPRGFMLKGYNTLIQFWTTTIQKSLPLMAREWNQN